MPCSPSTSGTIASIAPHQFRQQLPPQAARAPAAAAVTDLDAHRIRRNPYLVA
jgi:hypothetical protein